MGSRTAPISVCTMSGFESGVAHLKVNGQRRPFVTLPRLLDRKTTFATLNVLRPVLQSSKESHAHSRGFPLTSTPNFLTGMRLVPKRLGRPHNGIKTPNVKLRNTA